MADITQTSTSTSAPPDWMQGNWQNYINQINGLTGSPLPVYGGPTVAPMNPYQQTAGDMAYQFATNGTAAGNAARGTAINFAQNGGGFNPYAGQQNQYMGATNPLFGQQNAYAGANNPFVGQTNPYAGDNPYLQGVMDRTADAMARAYSQGTAAQTDAAFNQAGAYGGSAYQQQVQNNNEAFGNALGQTLGGLQYNNYLNSGNLAGQDLARNTAGYQNMLGLNAGTSAQDLSRNADLFNQSQGLNAQLAENQINRLTGAFGQQQANQLQGAQLGFGSEPLDLAAMQNLSNQGALQQGNTQNVLNSMQNYFNQSAMSPYASLDIMRNAYSAVPGQTVTSSGSQTGDSGSPSWLNWLGGAGALFNLFS